MKWKSQRLFYQDVVLGDLETSRSSWPVAGWILSFYPYYRETRKSTLFSAYEIPSGVCTDSKAASTIVIL